VQIGAFPSEGAAEGAWTDVLRIWPDQLAGKRHQVEATTNDDHSMYRSLIVGFRDRAEAQAFCAKLKASRRACLLK
jgi:hypothetical protein